MSADARQRREIVAQIDLQRREQNYNLLRIYNYYRVVIGIALLLVFMVGDRLLGGLFPQAFVLTTAIYILVNLAIALTTALLPRELAHHTSIAYAICSLDILALTYLMYLSGGVGSGIGTLSIVSVAAGSILVQGRVSTTLAATATLVTLYEEFYLTLAVPGHQADWFNAGILGSAYFLSSVGLQMFSARLRRSEITSLERAAEVAALERLNHLIIQRMHTGIVVSTRDGFIRMMNQSARRFIGLADNAPTPAYLPAELNVALARWSDNPELRTAPLAVYDGGPAVRVSFSPVTSAGDSDVIVFMEDTTELDQQAQQLKLAALGRLSASIAHEIRNPLGAISHAAQLLRESTNLDKGDERLTDIIQNHSRRMNGVIENVLELSRRRPPQQELLPLAAWLRQLVDTYLEGSETDDSESDAEIDIEVEPPDLGVRADPSQLGQVITNLIQNGLRYSRKRTGRARLRLVGGIDAPSERPYLDVIDEGEGVGEDAVANLFEPFYTTESSGTGLGLYISRELCEANQARISYRRADTGGSCFRIVFVHPGRAQQ